ncbi:ATP-binding protein [Streptomyces coffeae]|uniref:ATP-binding protein n=1 Tax=Streptomyces coffeae TaxID=621382 RepID=UPI0027DBBDD0|nr:ATP-binding protein [Streptomyces coffeae]
MAPSYEALRLGRGGTMVASCLQDVFCLPALSTSVAEARRQVVFRLRSWGVGQDTRDSAELVVSELFTNAVRHTSSEDVRCSLQLIGARLRLEVADQGCARSVPQARSVGVDQEGGRGLMLVEALSEAWGVTAHHHGTGRAVWAYLV